MKMEPDYGFSFVAIATQPVTEMHQSKQMVCQNKTKSKQIVVGKSTFKIHEHFKTNRNYKPITGI